MIRRVSGNSMLPTLRPGRIVIGMASYRSLKPGDLVVIYHDGLDKIKRVQAVKDSRLFVVGDNPHNSMDSRTFGWLPSSVVLAKVVWPLGRLIPRGTNP
jgi:nickel-type superoxide dismutase maturation protease